MSDDKKVHFVCFETTLDKEDFIKRWEQYSSSANSGSEVTLQQSEKNGNFIYLAQHRIINDEIQFVFSKESRSSRLAQERIITRQAGGYVTMQADRAPDAGGNDAKVFVFISDPRVDLDQYKKIAAPGKLNIYQAYYENCKYAYILEYFMKPKWVDGLMDQLKQYETAEVGIYKQCKHVKKTNDKDKESLYVWPSF